MNNCKKCKYLMARDICYFCRITGEEIKHPRFRASCKFFNTGNVSEPHLTRNITETNESISTSVYNSESLQDTSWGERRLTRISDVWSYLYSHGYSKTNCGDLLTEGQISELFRKILYRIVKNGGWLKIEDKQFTIDDTITLSDTDIKLLELLINDVENNKMFPDDEFRREE